VIQFPVTELPLVINPMKPIQTVPEPLQTQDAPIVIQMVYLEVVEDDTAMLWDFSDSSHGDGLTEGLDGVR
jgi:hypothetical protein